MLQRQRCPCCFAGLLLGIGNTVHQFEQSSCPHRPDPNGSSDDEAATRPIIAPFVLTMTHPSEGCVIIERDMVNHARQGSPFKLKVSTAQYDRKLNMQTCLYMLSLVYMFRRVNFTTTRTTTCLDRAREESSHRVFLSTPDVHARSHEIRTHCELANHKLHCWTCGGQFYPRTSM